MPTDFQVRTAPTTELQIRKLHKWFASFDADGNGVVDILDFTGMAQLYCEAYGIAPRSDAWRRMHGSAMRRRAVARASRGAPVRSRGACDQPSSAAMRCAARSSRPDPGARAATGR